MFVYPRLLVNVTSKSSVSAGVLVMLDRLNSNYVHENSNNKKMALNIRVPFTVNIAL